MNVLIRPAKIKPDLRHQRETSSSNHNDVRLQNHEPAAHKPPRHTKILTGTVRSVRTNNLSSLVQQTTPSLQKSAIVLLDHGNPDVFCWSVNEQLKQRRSVQFLTIMVIFIYVIIFSLNTTEAKSMI